MRTDEQIAANVPGVTVEQVAAVRDHLTAHPLTAVEREALIEKATAGVVANARRRGWRGNDAESWVLRSDAKAALVACDLIPADSTDGA